MGGGLLSHHAFYLFMLSFIVQMKYVSSRVIVGSFQGSLHLCIMQSLRKMSHLYFQHIKLTALYLRCNHSKTFASSPTDLDTGHRGYCIECNRGSCVVSFVLFYTTHSEGGHAESLKEEAEV